MDDHYELELADLLDRYRVAPVSGALRERIVAQAMAMPLPQPMAHRWARGAALLAATALFGFWCGSASLQNASPHMHRTTGTFDQMIWAPSSPEEVML